MAGLKQIQINIKDRNILPVIRFRRQENTIWRYIRKRIITRLVRKNCFFHLKIQWYILLEIQETHYMGLTVKNHNENSWLPPSDLIIVPDKVNIIAESGQGLGWLHLIGLTKLKEALAGNKGKNHVVIMNLGVNDAAGVGGYEIYDNADYYVEYMRDSVYKAIEKTLRR